MASRVEPMFEVVTVNGEERIAFRKPFNTNDLAELIDKRIVVAVKDAQRRRLI